MLDLSEALNLFKKQSSLPGYNVRTVIAGAVSLELKEPSRELLFIVYRTGEVEVHFGNTFEASPETVRSLTISTIEELSNLLDTTIASYLSL